MPLTRRFITIYSVGLSSSFILAVSAISAQAADAVKGQIMTKPVAIEKAYRRRGTDQCTST